MSSISKSEGEAAPATTKAKVARTPIKEALYLLQKVVRVAEKVGIFSCALKLLPFFSSST
jgi:hypothetical protein